MSEQRLRNQVLKLPPAFVSRWTFVAGILFLAGCGDDSPPSPSRSSRDDSRVQSSAGNSSTADSSPNPGVSDSALSKESSPSPTKRAGTSASNADKNDPAGIRSLIRELAKIDSPNVGLSPTMSGEGFAPVPSAGQVLNGVLTDHGLTSTRAFTKLVELGPKSLPDLLESLDDKTPTKLTIDHSRGFGGMWYGQRPAIRWAARDTEWVRNLVAHNLPDEKIAERVQAPPEFIAAIKSGKFPHLLPQAQREFNAANPAEANVLKQARQEFVEKQANRRDADSFETAIHKHTVTVGDVCYAIIGQITNRTYMAVQYQPTACVYIHSPTHDEQLARDVRAVWTSDNPEQMLLASLKRDLESKTGFSGQRSGAVLRLGYYFPRQSETLLIEILDRIELPPPKDADHPENEPLEDNRTLVKALVASKSDLVRRRTLELLKVTLDPVCFLDVQQAFGSEHDPLILERVRHFFEAHRESDGNIAVGVSFLRLVGRRFPNEAKSIYRKYVESPDTHRRDIVINALWNSPLAPEVLVPLLDDTRLLRYTDGTRVCDRAAQAISNDLKAVSFDNDAAQDVRDQQIEKIKLHCASSYD